MHKHLTRFLVLFLLTPFALSAQDIRIFESFEYRSNKYDFAYFLPKNFDDNKTYPVLIGPSDGTKGSDQSFFWNVESPGEFGWILVEFAIWKQNSNIVAALMKTLKEKFKVEGEKFHIVGFSANSSSIFSHVISNPDYFHSVTGIPGHPSTRNTAQIKSLKNVKIQNIVGEKDEYWLKSAEEFDELYISLEIESSLDIIPEGEHVLHHLVGKGFIEKMERMRD